MPPIWRAEIDLGPALVAGLLTEQFPELGTVRVREMSWGWDNWLFRVNDRYVFRFPRRRIAVPLIEKELKALSVFPRRLSSMIPQPIYLGQASADFPYPFYGYLWLPGAIVSEAGLSDIGRGRVARDLGRFLKGLHLVDSHTARAMGLGGVVHTRTDINALKGRLMGYLDQASSRGLIVDRAPWWDLSEVLGPAHETILSRGLVHGDLNFRNLLVDENLGLTAVIDWGDLHWGYPAVDLSLIWGMVPPEQRFHFFQTYGSVDAVTWELARFFAVYLNIIILVSAADLDLPSQVHEAQKELAWILVGE